MLASGTDVPVKDHFRELQVLSLLHGDKWFKYEWPSPVSAMTILSSGKEITSTLAPMPIGASSSGIRTAGCAGWLWAVSNSQPQDSYRHEPSHRTRFNVTGLSAPPCAKLQWRGASTRLHQACTKMQRFVKSILPEQL